MPTNLIPSENLIKILGIESLPVERKAVILDKASKLVQQRLVLRLLQNLPDSKKEEFFRLVEDSDSQKSAEFIEQNAPDFTSWVIEEVEGLKKELKDLPQPEL